MHRRFFQILILISFLSCSRSLSPTGAQIIEADERMVSNYQFIGTFEGGSRWGGARQQTGMKNSKAAVFNQAAQAGVTHVIFQNVQGGYSPFAVGRAYRCPK